MGNVQSKKRKVFPELNDEDLQPEQCYFTQKEITYKEADDITKQKVRSLIISDLVELKQPTTTYTIDDFRNSSITIIRVESDKQLQDFIFTLKNLLYISKHIHVDSLKQFLL